MSDEPFNHEAAEKQITDALIDQLLTTAEQLKTTREVMRKGEDSLDRRLQRAGLVRRQWKQTEEALPALMAEARNAGYTVEGIAYTLGLTESYVYRVLREQRAAQAEADDDDTSGHDWHHPTPSAGLRCRHCGLAHKNWSGEDCPAAE
ncbi:hypothetical protein [Streptomyces sp. NPDC016675]|uniref:hypothetical protein n=1 Tax=Streptomyces sp. NPDC016675 TaxID=3364970 RepID=UPI0036FEAC5D